MFDSYLKKIAVISFVLTASTTPYLAHAAYIWISPAELKALPTSGAAWDQIRNIAYSNFGTSKGDMNDNHDVNTLAQALVAARLDDDALKEKVVENLLSAKCEGSACTSLAISRNLTSYVIAADVIDFKNFDPSKEAVFRDWVEDMITKQHNGECSKGKCSIPDKFEYRPNNHGTHAGAAWAAAAVYLGRQSDLDRIAKVFKGWLGDRSSYDGFKYGDLDWQSDPSEPVGINPTGATIQGHNVDGVLPDDERRAGSFTWPPPKENYVYEALQGAIVNATILKNQGYNATEWNDKALLRAYKWLKNVANFPAEGDDTFQLPLVDYHYSVGYWNGSKTRHGKNMGWTDWTHASARSGGSSTSGSPDETLGPPKNVRLIVDDQ